MYILYDSIYIKMHKINLQYKLIYSTRRQISGLWERRVGGGGKKKGHKETFGVMDILSVTMLSWAYKHLDTFRIVYFEYVEFIVCQ